MEKDGWPTTYAEWVKNSQNYTAAMLKQGVILTKIEADPDEFSAWCRLHACKADRSTRSRYAAEKFVNIPNPDN